MAPEIAICATLGLAAIPHCTAMCGPLVCAGCFRSGGSAPSAAATYLMARWLAYAVAGGLAGLVGHALTPAGLGPAVRLGAHVLAAATLVLAGTRWLREGSSGRAERADHSLVLVSSAKRGAMRRTWVHRARQVASRIVALWARRVPRSAFGLGLVTVLFPCGALAGAWIVAASAGNVATGAASMSAFALASAPGLATLVGLGRGAGQWISEGSTRTRRAAGVLVVGVGLASAGAAIARPLLARAHAHGEHVPGHTNCACEHGPRPLQER